MKTKEIREVEVTYCDWCKKEIYGLSYPVHRKKDGLLHFHHNCYEQFFSNNKELKNE